jgi:hypothetical protein
MNERQPFSGFTIIEQQFPALNKYDFRGERLYATDCAVNSLTERGTRVDEKQ